MTFLFLVSPYTEAEDANMNFLIFLFLQKFKVFTGEYLAANQIAYNFPTKNANKNSNEKAKNDLANYSETPLPTFMIADSLG